MKVYRGCLTSNLLDKHTYQGLPTTNGQQWEITKDEAREMLKEMKNLDIRWNHKAKTHLGKIINSHITDDNKWEVDFTIDQGQEWLDPLLNDKIKLELSLAHWQNLRKPIEVSLCRIGSRPGSKIYFDQTKDYDNDDLAALQKASDDKFANLQTNDLRSTIQTADDPFTKTPESLHSDILIQASASQFLQQLPEMSQQQTEQPAAAPQQQQQPALNQLNFHEQPSNAPKNAGRPTQSPDDYVMGQGNTHQTEAQADQSRLQNALIAGIEADKFTAAMDRVLNVPSLSKADKGVFSEAFMRLIGENKELSNVKETSSEEMERLKRENDDLKKKTKMSEDHFSEQVVKLCEALTSLPGGEWDECKRSSMKEMAANGELNNFYSKFGPELIKCSMFVNQMLSGQQQSAPMMEEQPEPTQPYAEQLSRFMSNYKSNTLTRTQPQPVKCSLKRTGSQAFDDQPKSYTASNQQSNIPAAYSGLNSKLVNMLKNAAANAADYDDMNKPGSKQMRKF